MHFDEVITKYRISSSSEHDKGMRFERLMRAYLLTEPKYAAILRNVWLWEDFFAREELGSTDTGIDLVAETTNDEFWAVQCKFYDSSSTIDKPNVDTFLSTSGRTFHDQDGKLAAFSLRVWISTTDRWTANAESALHG